MKKTRRRRPKVNPRKLKPKMKGGMVDPRSIFVFGTMLMYGLASVFIGPLYLIAEILNAPITSINNFTRKAFNKSKPNWLHRPLLDLAFLNSEKPIKPEDFLLEEDMHIHQNVAVVSNDKHPDDETGNKKYEHNRGKEYSPSTYDSILHIFGKLNDKKKLKLLVFKLFDYIENLRANDEQRQKDIKRIMYGIKDIKVLIKFYLIYKTLKDKCPAIVAEKKTILKGADVVTIVNPFYNPCNISYTKRYDCLKKHLTQKRFDPNDPEDKVCRVSCDTCTFRNSISQLLKVYMKTGAWYGAISLIVSGVALLPEIAGLSAPMMAAATTGVNAAVSALGIGGGMGMVFAGSSAIIGTLIVVTGTNDAGNIFRNLAWMAMLPPAYSDVVKEMLNTYYTSIIIKNPEILDKTDEELDKGWTQQTIPIFKLIITAEGIREKPLGSVTTNIISLLDALKVEADLNGKIDEEDSEVIIEKFNRFICKYDVMKLLGWRIAQLYYEKRKSYSPIQILRFILADSKP